MDTTQELRADISGLPLTCSSQDAVDSFNEGLVAFVTLRKSPVSSFRAALERDEEFVMAHSMMGYLLLADLKPPTNPEVSAHVEAVKRLTSQCPSLHPRELAYAHFLQTYAAGDLLVATEILAVMLRDYPLDALALAILRPSFLFLSEFERLRDTLAWALSFWTEDMQLYPFVLALYAFALEECNERVKAETVVNRVLDINKDTPFVYHAMSHVLEETRDPKDGVEFLTGSRPHWSPSVYNGHLTWHLTLYYLEQGDTVSVLREFDEVLFDKATPDNYMGLLDASSLLWRLDVMGVEPGEKRWARVTEAMATRGNSFRSSWFSAHMMMSFARGKVSEAAARLALAQGMIKEMEEYCVDSSAFCQHTCEKFGLPVCNALLAFGKGQYDEVLQTLLPMWHNLWHIGGSWAQRQVFNSTLIEAAIQADNLPVAIGLVAELSARKPRNQRLKDLLEKLKGRLQGTRDIALPPAKRLKA